MLDRSSATSNKILVETRFSDRTSASVGTSADKLPTTLSYIQFNFKIQAWHVIQRVYVLSLCTKNFTDWAGTTQILRVSHCYIYGALFEHNMMFRDIRYDFHGRIRKMYESEQCLAGYLLLDSDISEFQRTRI